MKLFVAAIATIIPFTAFAQQPNCGPRESIVKHLAEKYGESPQSFGMSAGGSIFEVWANVETGTWTVLVGDANGNTCLPASGTNFERIDADARPTGAKL